MAAATTFMLCIHSIVSCYGMHLAVGDTVFITKLNITSSIYKKMNNQYGIIIGHQIGSDLYTVQLIRMFSINATISRSNLKTTFQTMPTEIRSSIVRYLDHCSQNALRKTGQKNDHLITNVTLDEIKENYRELIEKTAISARIIMDKFKLFPYQNLTDNHFLKMLRFRVSMFRGDLQNKSTPYLGFILRDMTNCQQEIKYLLFEFKNGTLIRSYFGLTTSTHDIFDDGSNVQVITNSTSNIKTIWSLLKGNTVKYGGRDYLIKYDEAWYLSKGMVTYFDRCVTVTVSLFLCISYR